MIEEVEDLYTSADLVMSGSLLKQGFGRIYKPWSTRIFKFYARNLVLTYENNEGKLKGVCQVEDSVVEPLLLPVGEKKDFAFRVYVKRINPDTHVISHKREE